MVVNYIGDNPIANTIPLTQFKALYQDFEDTLQHYGIKGYDHPYYNIMLRNFMNHKLRKAFSTSQYLDFLESSAITDFRTIKKYVGYVHYVFANTTATSNFFNGINGVNTAVPVQPVLRLKNSNNTEDAFIDFRYIPKHLLRTYRNYCNDYYTAHSGSISSYTVNELSSSNSDDMGQLFINASSAFNPNTIPNNDALTFTFTQNAQLWNGVGYNDVKVYAVTTNYNTHYENNAKSTYISRKYLLDNGIDHEYFSSIYDAVNEEYFKNHKKAYLNYAYEFDGMSPSGVLENLSADSVVSNVYNFNNLDLSYGHPAQPGRFENLYFYDPNTATDNTQFAKLTTIIQQVKSALSDGVLFTGNNTLNIPQSNNKLLTGYRCDDRVFWYRYFAEGDSLFNIFLKIPEYVDTIYWSGYRVTNYKYNVGDGNSRSFRINLYNSSAPIQNLVLDGYTDFTVATSDVLHNLVLAHPVNEGIPVADTINNCERSLLKTAIIQGKLKYRNYIDSIRYQLKNDFYAYIMNGGIQENLFVSYRNQRFNYTLYNYDRAGNLIITVPPAGVRTLANNELNDVNNHRLADDGVSLAPIVAKPSLYFYNTLNQVVEQNTPDGGKTEFFYDAAGRVIFSQNAKQRPTGEMTYTLYDKQGRIFETGVANIACPYFTPIKQSSLNTSAPACSYFDETTNTISSLPNIVTDLVHRSHEEVIQYVKALNRKEVVVTHYDAISVNVQATPGFAIQENLRKRVASIKYFDHLAPTDHQYANYQYAQHFSYDVTGNVKTLVRDYPALKMENMQFVRIDYDYDVISGKVNMLSYNRGFPDQFYQQYSYDADNRITNVKTSNDGIIWQQDATYEYYQHGPLARMSLGELNVQGVDYAYTIQGWLKAINGDQLKLESDMGKDGVSISPMQHGVFANDAIALSIDYFNGDYKPIGTDTVTRIASLTKNLYNGNIPRTTTSIIPFPDLATSYTYDQLNRIIKADYANMERQTAALTHTADYYSSYAYDPDGNLKKLARNGNKSGQLLMDSLNYYYEGSYATSSVHNNKLVNITDYAANNYTNDIQNYTTSNVNRYNYDAIGNLTSDLVSGQDNIAWNHYNKVTMVNNYTQQQNLHFKYDGAGQRYLKSVENFANDRSKTQSDYYVRDAQGNILAIYKHEGSLNMTRSQWIEYITEQIYVLCNRQIAIERAIAPTYAYNPNFRAQVMDYINTNDSSWIQSYLDSHTAIDFLADPQVYYRTINSLGAFSNAYADIYDFEQQHGKAILAPVLAKYLLADTLSTPLADWRRYQFFKELYTKSDSILGNFYSQLCHQAPDVMQQVINDYRISLDPGMECREKSNLLSDYITSHTIAPADFINEIKSVGMSVNVAEYQNFLKAIYSPAVTYYNASNNDYRTAVELAYLHAKPVVYDVGKNFLGLNIKGETLEYDVPIIVQWMGVNKTRIQQFHDLLIQQAFKGHTAKLSDYIGVILGGSGRRSNYVAFDKAVNHLCQHMPESVMTDVCKAYYLEYNPDADSLSEVLKERLAQHVEPYHNYHVLQLLSNAAIAYPDSFNHFVHAILQEDAIVNNDVYLGAQAVGSLMPMVQQALVLDTTMRNNMYVFMENWPEATNLVLRSNANNDLLQALYQQNASQVLNDYIDHHSNSTDIITQSLTAIPNLTPGNMWESFSRVDLYCLRTVVVDSIFHDMYTRSGANSRIALASHVLYGSSRLGTKDYLPGQYYRSYLFEDSTSVYDTLTLGGRRPWYSLEYNDAISALSLSPYGNTDHSSFYANHQIGMKQYELSNHLGNVQATVTDLPHTLLNDDIIMGHTPAIASAYDYYPFGMLMPDRYVSDTSSKCMTLTQSRWVTTWVDSCYNLSDLIWKQDTTGGAIAVGTTGNGMEIDAPRVNSSVSFALDVEPAVEQLLTFEIASLTAGTGSMIAVEESIGGQWKTLNNVALDKTGLITLSFVPLGNGVKVSVTGPTKVILNRICRKKPIQYQESYLTQVCNGDKDRYRFGFNGAEKDNEMKGVGNSLDFGARMYDSRVGRFNSIDPLFKKYPEQSSYVFAGNNPIYYIDKEGLERYASLILHTAGQDGTTVVKLKMNDDLISDRPSWDPRSADWYDIEDKYYYELDGKGKILSSYSSANNRGKHRAWTLFNTISIAKYIAKDDDPSIFGVQVMVFGSSTDFRDWEKNPKGNPKAKTYTFDFGEFSKIMEPIMTGLGIKEPDFKMNSGGDIGKGMEKLAEFSKEQWDKRFEQDKRNQGKGSGVCKDCGGYRVYDNGNEVTDPNKVQEVLKKNKDSLHAKEHK
jgi:RHS repeat-associated protein